jgi:hypothetical protein
LVSARLTRYNTQWPSKHVMCMLESMNHVPSKQNKMERLPVIEDFIAIHNGHSIGQR